MEDIVAEENSICSAKPRKGGFRTMPFIIVNESFEKVASYGLMPNMIFYLMEGYQMQVVSATNILFLWSATSNTMAIFGAFLSDSYLGRFRVISLGSISSLLGMTILWLTAMIPQLKPPSCESQQVCESATAAQLALLLSSFGLISIGAGCIRPCSIAFGADQLDNKENPNKERLLASFFNWYYASIGVSTVLALTLIVYIQDNLGWTVGFGVPVILMIISTLIFLAGRSLYVKVKPSKSLFTGFALVVVVAFKNRKLSLPQSNSDQYCHSHDSNFLVPTDNLRCLNKACMIRDRERDLNTDESASDSWSLCTVEQVESLKALLRVIPMWSTGIIMFLCLNQNSFSTLQAKTMDRHITRNFEIPAGSFTVFMIVTLTIWVAFYDRIMAPLLAKYTGRPQGLSTKVRMGIGLLLASAALAVGAITEAIRRRIAIEEGFVDSPNAVIDMSALWLVPQFALLGLAEAFNAIGQIEFYYSQLPKSMSSIAVAIFTLGTAVANLVGSLLVDIVNGITSKNGNESWLSSNLNKGHIDYYYGLISFLGLMNFIYFCACCRFYGPAENEKTRCSEDIQNGQFDYSELPSS
ncbi:protein NRT1/ PTR FAMILY 1.2-like [Fagus crenata]